MSVGVCKIAVTIVGVVEVIISPSVFPGVIWVLINVSVLIRLSQVCWETGKGQRSSCKNIIYLSFGNSELLYLIVLNGNKLFHALLTEAEKEEKRIRRREKKDLPTSQ